MQRVTPGAHQLAEFRAAVLPARQGVSALQPAAFVVRADLAVGVAEVGLFDVGEPGPALADQEVDQRLAVSFDLASLVVIEDVRVRVGQGAPALAETVALAACGCGGEREIPGGQAAISAGCA